MNPEWEQLKKDIDGMLTIPDMKILILELMEKAYKVGYTYGKKDK